MLKSMISKMVNNAVTIDKPRFGTVRLNTLAAATAIAKMRKNHPSPPLMSDVDSVIPKIVTEA